KLLFFLDDAQWADQQTLEAVSYLVTQGFFDTKGLLVIASRGEEPNRDLNEMIDRFHRTHNVQTINIIGLSPQELGTLVDQALEETPSSGFLDQLYRETNGNPFLALEIVRNLLEFPGEFEKAFSSSPLPLPESVHAVIRKRLNNLDDQTRRILLCAAVIGNEFPLDLLSTVIDMGPQFDIKFLDPLIKFGFIFPTGKGKFQKSDLKFSHEIIRKVVLKEASPLQLGKIHHRIADHLAEGSQAGSQAARIANHYLACGEIHSAFRWYIKAAAHTWSLGAKDETNQIFRQAESLYKKAQQNKITASDVFELYRQWAQFAYEADQIDLLEEVGFKLQYLGEQAHNPLFLGAAQMTLANACFLRLKMDTGLELIHKAIDYLQHAKDKQVMMEAKLRQAAIYWWTMDYDQTILICQEVLEIVESLEASNRNLNEYLFFVRHIISYSHYAKGNANKALHHATTIYHQYFHQLSAFNRMRTYTMLANANLIAANYQKSQWFAEEGLKIA
ncbi:MAG: hypothetical protein U9R21_09550, partial [Candidatus Thermoplasmatota archaeon]|nr:hypothetical protein [Candidatus Thermoplasmatota archaeon]